MSGFPFPKAGELSTRLITEAKSSTDRSHLSVVSAVPLQQAFADADRAYRNFFTSSDGSHRERSVGHPRFCHHHDACQTARFTKNARFSVVDADSGEATVRLPKIGDVRFVSSRSLSSEASSVTVIREADGWTYVSVVVWVVDEITASSELACGLTSASAHS